MSIEIKSLKDLIFSLKAEKIIGRLDKIIRNIAIDSRKIQNGDLFIAINGHSLDGHEFIDQAIYNGATAILCTSIPNKINNNVTYIQVTDTNIAAGKLAHKFFENSSHQFTLIGITGTNGKSSIAHILHEVLGRLGFKAGLFSTIEIRIGDEVMEASLTTPDTISINRIMKQMVDSRCEYVIMEVSSHAIHQKRIEDLDFDIAVFTNLTHDHLGYHGGLDNYRDVKKSWFDSLSTKTTAIINSDDKNGAYMVQNSKAKIKYFGLRTMADYKVKIVDNSMMGLQLQLNGVEIQSVLRGSFNAYNLCAAYGVATELDLDNIQILESLSSVQTIKGRFEMVYDENKCIWGVIDYAHTPDALDKVLANVHEIKNAKNRMITIVGCGGDRDKKKRPMMAQIAIKWSDHIILTSDNPRSEDPEQIIQDMIDGLDEEEQKLSVIMLDRKAAIFRAVEMASKSDVIVIAGKGHEKYQEIKGNKYPFDDLVIMKKAFQL